MKIDEREILEEKSSEFLEIRKFNKKLKKEKIDSKEILRQILHDFFFRQLYIIAYRKTNC